MTTIASLRSLASIVPPPAAGTAAGTPAPVSGTAQPSPAAVPGAAGARSGSPIDELNSMLPPLSGAPWWEKKSNDAITSLMTVNYGATPLSARWQGLGAALLQRFDSDGGGYSQSVSQAPPGSGAQAPAAKSALHGAAANRIALDIRTADGVQVTLALGSQDNGLAVQLASSGKLSAADRGALSQLAGALQKAIDGIAAVPPRLDLGGLAGYDAALLSSVDLHAQVRSGDATPQTVDFHADGAQRSVAADGPGGSVKVSVDLKQLAGLGDAQQRRAAMDAYLEQFDQAGSRGHADAAILAMFKDAFRQMQGALPQHVAQPQLLTDGDHALLTGLADFSAAIADTPRSANPMRPGERDTFSYRVSQATAIGGHGPLERSLSQRQHAQLDASYHEPPPAGAPLALDNTRQSQNYDFRQIGDDAASDAEAGYDKGILTRASLRQTVHQSMRVQHYVMGRLSGDDTAPTSVQLARDLLGLLRTDPGKSGRTPLDAALRQQALAALHDAVLLQADPAQLRAAGGA